jgi:hypothetical protein
LGRRDGDLDLEKKSLAIWQGKKRHGNTMLKNVSAQFKRHSNSSAD